MKRLLALSLLLLLIPFTGCQKFVSVPVPDVTPQIQAIANSNMTPEGKQTAIQQVLQVTETEYQALLARLDKAGSNVKDAWVQLLSFGASIASITIQATK